ncbi:succinate--CoA ligase subunit alpha [Leekyejoonella antrihumi]|uniref:Succinyl-CoA synthetase subunit alpha n=1 Tax=Leekyejoonella antrihumi TaxID=1660198 RepID=A0A563DXP1_9MICO|nr:succinyl-CoA synthetase subunit alpha [Leekyejoonella antrihumi]TWP34986.1 succinyl-CoA synthetase subunit alpha [Leekyejoonella antrihumi]
MLVNGNESVIVQGLTGGQGTFWSARMKACGTNIVAGSSPGKGGRRVDGVPVYNSACEAARDHKLDVSVLFVPPMAAAGATLDAIHAGVRKIVLLTEHVPYQDTMRILAEAVDAGAQVLGPNTAGLVVPGESAVGIMPGLAANIFQPGNVGVLSRSGSLGTLVCLNLVADGYGQSAFIGIGGDPILGTTTLDALRTLDQDPQTEAVVLVGEIGGVMEEEAADYVAEMSKPVVAFIAGRSAPPNTRMGHAGAIITGTRGSGESKASALTAAGAHVVDLPSQIGSVLDELGVRSNVVGAA